MSFPLQFPVSHPGHYQESEGLVSLSPLLSTPYTITPSGSSRIWWMDRCMNGGIWWPDHWARYYECFGRQILITQGVYDYFTLIKTFGTTGTEQVTCLCFSNWNHLQLNSHPLSHFPRTLAHPFLCVLPPKSEFSDWGRQRKSLCSATQVCARPCAVSRWGRPPPLWVQPCWVPGTSPRPCAVPPVSARGHRSLPLTDPHQQLSPWSFLLLLN